MNLTLQDVVTGRTHEFRQSLRALGVRDEDIFETGWSDIEPLKDYEEFQKKLRDLILGYERKVRGSFLLHVVQEKGYLKIIILRL